MQDLWTTPTLEQLRRRGGATPEAAPPPIGFLDSIGIGMDRAEAGPDWGMNQANYEGRIRSEMIAALKARGVSLGLAYADPRFGGQTSGDRALFIALARIRAREPGFLKDYADVVDADSLRARALRNREERLAELPSNTNMAGEFAGGIIHGLRDPLSYLPIGFLGKTAGQSVARQIVGAAGRGAAINAGVTTVIEPAVQLDADALDIDRGAEDFLFALGVSAGAGGIISGTFKGGALGIDALTPLDVRVAREIGRARIDPEAHAGVAEAQAARRAFDALPAEMRERWREAGTEADRAALADLDARVPLDRRTPDEEAAAHVVERSAEVAEASPYHATPAGDEAHAAQLDHWLDRITGEEPNATRGTAPRPPVTRSQVASGSAPEGSLRMPAREQLAARIRAAESGGNDRARNPNSTATGRYQFTMGTWLSYYKRRYGGKEGNSAIWAKRYDPNLQEVLFADLTADNARMLRDAGQPETAGHLYLLHFAGPDGLKVLKAAPDMPVERLLQPAAIAANKFLKGMTAGDLTAWANRKMGSAGDAPAVRSAAAAPERLPDGEAAVAPQIVDIDIGAVKVADILALPDGLAAHDRPVLRAALFATPEEHAAAQLGVWRERDALDGFAAIVDDPLPAGPAVEVPNRAPVRRSGPRDVMRAIADAGGILDNEGHDLVKGRGIPRFQRGAGVIIHPDGTPGARSIDGLGEYLWEEGYFGPPSTTPRPREAQVLELIERAARKKVYRPEDQAAAMESAARRRGAPDEDEVVWELTETAREMGVELDPRTLDDAMMRRARGTPAEDAVEEAVAAARFRDSEPAAGLERFDDPDGQAAEAQMASIEHDLRMMAPEKALAGDYRVDVDGEPVNLAGLLNEIDNDIDAAATLRACME